MSASSTDSNDNLIHAVYPELRAIAGRLLRNERGDHTLQRTALVHEAFIRLFKNPPDPEVSPKEFLALAAHQMRNILIDYGRRHRAQRRGGSLVRVPLFEADHGQDRQDDELLAFDEALNELGRLDRRLLTVVELKIFSGCTNGEAAEVLGISSSAVQEDWKFAKSWLYRELTK